MAKSKQNRPVFHSNARAVQFQHGGKGSLPRRGNQAATCNAEGNTAFAQGRFAQAKSAYLLAVAYDPSYADAHYNLGNLYYAQQDFVSALGSYRHALATGKPQADLCNSLGVTCFALNDAVSAKTYLLQAIALDPRSPDAFFNLGNVLTKECEYTLAIRCFETAVSLHPAHVRALHNLGGIQQRLGDLSAATESYLQALRLAPNDPDIRNNLADALTLQGRPEGLALFERLIAEQPASPDAHWNASTAFLLHGDYTRGWQEYEWRWKSRHFTSPRRNFPSTAWDGRPLEGSSILVYAEQGFGDILQFVRYLPMLAERGGRIYLQVPAALKRLLTNYPGVVQFSCDDEQPPKVDYHCAMMSLPFFFKTTLETIPPPIPFQTDEVFPTSIPADDSRVKVGLVWAGSPEHQYDNLRSLSLANLLPLAEVAGLQFISLQKGPAAKEIGQGIFPEGIVDGCSEARDFADTARVIEGLDLVIAVDTAVAHLAASMGKPVWILLRNLPEWRWGLSLESSPWYSSARLFRKPFGTDWQTFMIPVSSELETFARDLYERRSHG
jgi:tetratricopeptide (TPR) repeat protein